MSAKKSSEFSTGEATPEMANLQRRLETGMELRMKESYRKGVANHPDPESCVACREAAIEA
jgi:hypothetical protein